MKNNKRMRITRILVTTIAVSITMLIFGWLFLFLPVDFSQDYKRIHGIENVVFQRNGSSNFYKRCFWGLRRIESPVTEVWSKDDVRVWEVEGFADAVEQASVRQAILSPDGNYILYCELKYNYKNTGLTDDEYCYYRVYDIATGEVVTIYSGYKEWYNLGWL